MKNLVLTSSIDIHDICYVQQVLNLKKKIIYKLLMSLYKPKMTSYSSKGKFETKSTTQTYCKKI